MLPAKQHESNSCSIVYFSLFSILWDYDNQVFSIKKKVLVKIENTNSSDREKKKKATHPSEHMEF